MKKSLLYISICLAFLFPSCSKKLKEGDLIFHSSASSQSRAIQLATHSKYSHMGILFKKDGEWFVLEAVEPVRYTPLYIWIKRGVNSHYVVKRLKNADEVLNEDVVSKMRDIGESFLDRNYDYYFEWSDERMYCSELVWKIYHRVLDVEIGKPADIEKFDFSSEEVKRQLRERFGDKIPPHNDKIISPGEMFDSDLLKKIVEK